MVSIDSAYSQVNRVNNPTSQRDINIAQSNQGVTDLSSSVQIQNDDLDKRIGPAYDVEVYSKSNESWNDSDIRRLKQTGAIECQTCKNRQYQDGSNDPGVSFKAPGHISPESSAAVVQSHEQEHVSNEQASALREGRKVVSQSVKLFTAVCPECGSTYVSGGETRTTTASDEKQDANQSETIKSGDKVSV